MNTLSAGDLIRVTFEYRGLPYQHFGIAIGDGTVIHLASDRSENPVSQKNMQVRQVSTEAFAAGRTIVVEQSSSALPVEETLRRATEALGDSFYHLTERNCEHFARWCKSGKSESFQVETVQEGTRCAVRSGVKLIAKVASNVTFGRTILRTVAPKLASTAKFHPAAWLGDVVDISIRISARQFGYDSETSQRAGWYAGCTTVGVVGFAVGGPVGSSAMLGMHIASAQIADAVIDRISDCVGEQPIR